MSTIKEVRLRLPEEEYDRLMEEAERHGISADKLAGVYVHEALSKSDGESRSRRAGIRALEELRFLRQHLSDTTPIDAVDMVREGRQELQQRTSGHGLP